jgi:uncharacterized Fe-S radical SAM superfamily protein PflX
MLVKLGTQYPVALQLHLGEDPKISPTHTTSFSSAIIKGLIVE